MATAGFGGGCGLLRMVGLPYLPKAIQNHSLREKRPCVFNHDLRRGCGIGAVCHLPGTRLGVDRQSVGPFRISPGLRNPKRRDPDLLRLGRFRPYGCVFQPGIPLCGSLRPVCRTAVAERQHRGIPTENDRAVSRPKRRLVASEKLQPLVREAVERSGRGRVRSENANPRLHAKTAAEVLVRIRLRRSGSGLCPGKRAFFYQNGIRRELQLCS